MAGWTCPVLFKRISVHISVLISLLIYRISVLTANPVFGLYLSVCRSWTSQFSAILPGRKAQSSSGPTWLLQTLKHSMCVVVMIINGCVCVRVRVCVGGSIVTGNNSRPRGDQGGDEIAQHISTTTKINAQRPRSVHAAVHNLRIHRPKHSSTWSMFETEHTSFFVGMSAHRLTCVCSMCRFALPSLPAPAPLE